MNEDQLATEVLQQVELHEVDIAYSEQTLLKKLNAYQLNPEALYSGLRINPNALAQVETSNNSAANTYLTQLVAELEKWPRHLDIKTFTASVNHLVYLWLNALQDGASTQHILDLLKCFDLKTKFGFSKAAKLHCFLFNLVVETVQQYQEH